MNQYGAYRQSLMQSAREYDALTPLSPNVALETHVSTEAIYSDATLEKVNPYGTFTATKHSEQIRRLLHWNYRAVR